MDNINECTINKLNSLTLLLKDDVEIWMARDIQPVLGYQKWSNFLETIERARAACRGVGIDPKDHIAATSKKIEIGKGATRVVDDYFLSRYACYLIAMNADSSKPEIAAAQTYFAIQTRRMEQQDAQDALQRLEMRERVRDANKELNNAAHEAGVLSSKFGIFHDAGYRGLYTMSLREIKERKGIDKDDLLDRAGHAELAANYFRITQTEQKLRRDNVNGERKAIDTHKEVGAKVRSTIKELGGTMPEDLPAEKPIKQLKKEIKGRMISNGIKEDE
jgi:DNA-damage-inducible protein D